METWVVCSMQKKKNCKIHTINRIETRITFLKNFFRNEIVSNKFTWVTGSFIINTSVTLPNIPKYSFSFSADVCQLKPPTNSLPGAESVLFGVERPDEPECDAVVVPLFFGIFWSFFITANALCKSCEISVPFTFSMVALKNEKWKIQIN